jgi:hypothetical protein
MTEARDSKDRLVTASEIAEIAQVTPSAVSNWRKRDAATFPRPAGSSPTGGDLFRLSEVARWLKSHRAPPVEKQIGAADQLWAVAERLRGQVLMGDIAGVTAVAAAFIHLSRDLGAPGVIDYRDHPVHIGDRVQDVAASIERAQPSLSGLFEPLRSIDPNALRLLLDSLDTFSSGTQMAAAVDQILQRATRYGEFRSAPEIADLLVRIADPHGVVLDPAVGSGEFLIDAARAARRDIDVYGQELNENTWRLAVSRLVLRDIEPRIARGDSFKRDAYPDLRAEVALCDPPAGMRHSHLLDLGDDPRWRLLGLIEPPPGRAAGFAWLAHVIYHLAEDGRGYVLLPIGSLFNRGAEGRLRSELIRQGMIEAVIALPAGAMESTGVRFAIWVVRPKTPNPQPVLLIDGHEKPGSLSSQLSEQIANTINEWRSDPDRFEASPGFAATVAVLDLLGGDASLLPSRWVYEPEVIDVHAAIETVERARNELDEARARTTTVSPEIGMQPAPEPLPRVRVGDLISLDQATLIRPARLRAKEDITDTGPGLPVWQPGDIRDPWRRGESPKFVDPALVDPKSITRPGDIVLTTIGGIRCRVDVEGGHVLATSLLALRLNTDALDPHAVAALLTSEPNRRLLSGTIPRIDVLELEIPSLDLAAARRVREILRELECELETAHAVVTRTEELRKALVEALATGTVTIGDTTEANHD